MGVTIFRPGQRLVIPSPGVQVWSPRAASAAASWWDNNGAISGCVAAYAPKGAADLASSYINLANPGTNNAAPGTAPTWDATGGWTFNGTTQYLTTGIVPTNNQTWSAIVRFSNASADDSSMLFGGGSYFAIQQRRSGGAVGWWSGGFLTETPGVTTGVLGFAGATAYRNGAAVSGSIGSGGGTFSALYIGAANSGGSPILHANIKIQALAIYSATLTAGEVATITTAMQAL